MKFPPYLKYKPSGVEWLGDVPEHWGVKRLGYAVSKIGSGKTPRGGADVYQSDGVMLIRSQNVHDTGLRLEDVVFVDESVDEEMAGTRVRPGDVLLNITGASLGRCTVAPPALPRANVNQHVCIVRPDLGRADARFLHRSISSAAVQSQIFGYENGSSREGLNFQQVRTLVLAFPPAPEQQAIADFLDRETGRMDRLVAKKRELIARLKEKRAALISRAVTRGLPPAAARAAGLPANPPLRPSGVDWLGDIPEHWEILALRWRARCWSGDFIATEEVSPERTPERQVPVIGGNGVMGYCDRPNCTGPVLVIGRVGALCGNVHRVSPPAWVTDNALVMDADPATFSREYLAEVLRTRNLNDLADKTAQPLVTGTRVRNERVPAPPLLEQTAIAAYLDTETAKLDALVAKVETAIERLQEYRTALITAAVTGKIDVRRAVV